MSVEYLCKSCGAMLEDSDIRTSFNPEQSDEPESIYRNCIPCKSGEVVELEPVEIVHVLADLMARLKLSPNCWGDKHIQDFQNAKELAVHLRGVW